MESSTKVCFLTYSVNVLKSLGDQPFLFKCHKMLKTSNNLYLVYDFMGKYPTLANLIENNSINGQSKSNYLAYLRKNYSFTNSEMFNASEEKRYCISRFKCIKHPSQ